MWFDDVKISIDSEEIEVIKNGLIENRYIDECEFEIESDKLDYTICDAYMMPITIIVDTRNNANPEYDHFHRILQGFLNEIKEYNGKYIVDLSIICVGEKIQAVRDYCKKTTLDSDIMYYFPTANKNTKRFAGAGAAMFLAWYRSELCKRQYRSQSIRYYQPIFVLLSNLKIDESLDSDSRNLLNSMTKLYNLLQHSYKLAVIKHTYQDARTEYYDAIDGMLIDDKTKYHFFLRDLYWLSSDFLSDLRENFYISDENGDFFLDHEECSNNEKNDILEALEALFNTEEDDD